MEQNQKCTHFLICARTSEKDVKEERSKLDPLLCMYHNLWLCITKISVIQHFIDISANWVSGISPERQFQFSIENARIVVILKVLVIFCYLFFLHARFSLTKVHTLYKLLFKQTPHFIYYQINSFRPSLCLWLILISLKKHICLFLKFISLPGVIDSMPQILFDPCDLICLDVFRNDE